MYDAEVADEVDLPEKLRDLFEQGHDEADLHAMGVAMVARSTGVAVPEAAIASLKEAHPIPDA